MMLRAMAAIALVGLSLGGCVVEIGDPAAAKRADMTVPISEMHYETEYTGGQTEPVHDLLPEDDPDRAAVMLYFRGKGVSYQASMMDVEWGDGTASYSPVFLARDGGLLLRRGRRYYRVGTYAGTAGSGPMTPRQELKVQWEGATLTVLRHKVLPQALYTLKLTSQPPMVPQPNMLVPDCNSPPDRREPASLYYVEVGVGRPRADQEFKLKAYMDGVGRGYALMRLPVAETFKAEVDPVAHTITVTGEASYPDATPEKGCVVVGGKGNYHTPVTVDIPVTAPAGTYTVRIPDTHYRSGAEPDITKNYFTKSSRQEMTITVQ